MLKLGPCSRQAGSHCLKAPGRAHNNARTQYVLVAELVERLHAPALLDPYAVVWTVADLKLFELKHKVSVCLHACSLGRKRVCLKEDVTEIHGDAAKVGAADACKITEAVKCMVRDRSNRYLRDPIGHQVFMDLWRRLSSQKHRNVATIVRPKRTDEPTESRDRIAPGKTHDNSLGSRPR